MEVIKSNKGHGKMCLGGYVYTRHKPVNLGTRWRCVNRTSGCKGALIFYGDKYRLSVSHSHPPDNSTIKVIKARAKMKDLAVSTTEKPAAILAQVTASLMPGEKVALKSEHSLKRCIRAQRSSSLCASASLLNQTYNQR